MPPRRPLALLSAFARSAQLVAQLIPSSSKGTTYYSSSRSGFGSPQPIIDAKKMGTMANHPQHRRGWPARIHILLLVRQYLLAFFLASAQDLSSLPTAAQAQIRRQLQQRKEQLRRMQQNSNAIKNPWGKTVQDLAAKWGDEKGTVQKYSRDFRVVLKLHEIDKYMSTIVHSPTDPTYQAVRDTCLLKHEYCAEMAVRGLCPPNSMGLYEYNAIGQCPEGAISFIENNCAPACNMCHLQSYKTRCTLDKEEAKQMNVFQKDGDLNAMFARILRNEKLRHDYGPMVVHSRPGGEPYGSDSAFDGPYIITFDNFLSPEECAVLRHNGAHTGEGFSRSNTGTGKHLSNSTDIRTSSTNWCRDGCHEDKVVQKVHRRIESLTGIPQGNYEFLQILRYEEGQYYKIHHDYNELELDRPQGVRLLTVFLYLSDVEEGGGTTFNELYSVGDNIGAESIEGTGGELTIQAKMGRAVIWPSVVDSDPNLPDRRARHGAQKVIKGVKYGANAWIHQRDYKTSYSKACHDEDGVTVRGI